MTPIIQQRQRYGQPRRPQQGLNMGQPGAPNLLGRQRPPQQASPFMEGSASYTVPIPRNNFAQNPVFAATGSPVPQPQTPPQTQTPAPQTNPQQPVDLSQLSKSQLLGRGHLQIFGARPMSSMTPAQQHAAIQRFANPQPAPATPTPSPTPTAPAPTTPTPSDQNTLGQFAQGAVQNTMPNPAQRMFAGIPALAQGAASTDLGKTLGLGGRMQQVGRERNLQGINQYLSTVPLQAQLDRSIMAGQVGLGQQDLLRQLQDLQQQHQLAQGDRRLGLVQSLFG